MKIIKEITFLIPTYNSERYIKKTLSSIKKQSYNKTKYEVFIIDGGSTDETISIVKGYQRNLPIKIIKNKNVDAESGKYKGIMKSSSKYIVLLDSDNEIVNKDWLKTAVNIFENHSEVWGIESPWLVNKKDKLINQYFSMMKMTDPIARLFKPTQEEVLNYNNYQIVKLHKTDTPVMGANGFFWRRNLVSAKINNTNKFEETNYVSFLISSGRLNYARLTKHGIYHYYCYSIGNYINKRKKIAKKFLERKKRRQNTWVDRVGKFKFGISVFYNASFILPSFEAGYQIIRTRNIAWIYHPVICFLTFAIYLYYFLLKIVKSE